MTKGRWVGRAVSAVAVLLALPVMAPPLLAFPYKGEIGAHRVYSVEPIDPSLAALIDAADAKVAHAGLSAARPTNQPIFLTGGGWRWTWLALQNRDSFAVSRPVTETIVIGRIDRRAGEIVNSRPVDGRRGLEPVLAHEMTHGLIRARFGAFASRRFPTWLVEGFCDHVAGESSLSDADARALIARGEDHPALVYWRGRKRVENELRRNGGSAERLFARSGA